MVLMSVWATTTLTRKQVALATKAFKVVPMSALSFGGPS